MPKLLVDRRDAVTVLTLNRPEVHNNVDDETAMLVADAIDAFAADDDAEVLVIAGAGDRTFCAGANLKGMAELFEHRRTHDAGPMGFARLDPDKPVIAAVNGNCYAGGVELAAWCDFRIVDEHGCHPRSGARPPHRGLLPGRHQARPEGRDRHPRPVDPGRARPRGRAVPRPGARSRGRRGHATVRRGQQARVAAAGHGGGAVAVTTARSARSDP